MYNLEVLRWLRKHGYSYYLQGLTRRVYASTFETTNDTKRESTSPCILNGVDFSCTILFSPNIIRDPYSRQAFTHPPHTHLTVFPPRVNREYKLSQSWDRVPRGPIARSPESMRVRNVQEGELSDHSARTVGSSPMPSDLVPGRVPPSMSQQRAWGVNREMTPPVSWLVQRGTIGRSPIPSDLVHGRVPPTMSEQREAAAAWGAGHVSARVHDVQEGELSDQSTRTIKLTSNIPSI